MKKYFYYSIIITSLLFSGCASLFSLLPGYRHVSAFCIGTDKSEIVSFAKHIFSGVKKVYFIDKGTSNEKEIWRFAFFSDADVCLCFYKEKFFQAILIKPDSDEELEFREDFKNPRIGGEYPRYYIASRGNNVGKMETYY